MGLETDRGGLKKGVEEKSKELVREESGVSAKVERRVLAKDGNEHLEGVEEEI